jgi:UDP:flavonoid glycosyltransferase YjiC (YdhE family)
MRPELRDEMLQAFARFPEYRFIWRFTKVDENIKAIINKYPNVHALEWVQQASILAHPKTRGFISHVGLNSYNEAAHYGVPIVAIPCFGDQFGNSVIAVKRGIAVQISRKEINTELLSNALNQILYNPRYDLVYKPEYREISKKSRFFTGKYCC